MACLAIVPLLNWLGGPNTILFAAVMAALAGAVWATTGATRKATAGLGVRVTVGDRGKSFGEMD